VLPAALDTGFQTNLQGNDYALGGRGVPQDYAKARELFEKGAAKSRRGAGLCQGTRVVREGR